MTEIRRTHAFAKWLDALPDIRARARVMVRVDRLADGNPGDVRSLGGGLIEMRIDCGPGYRVYYVRQGRDVVVLLAGGDKSTQTGDIKKARRLAAGL